MANLELYKIFIEVAKVQNITRASENLNISQPAVTRHIKNLENELNLVLFNRKKGMELTEAGNKLFNEISPSIDKIVEIDKKYLNICEIRLGTYATMLSKLLSKSIAEFYLKNKNAKIITITDNSKVLNFPLNDENFDIAILRKFKENEYDSKKYKFISLGYFEYVLIANNKSKLCSKNKIKISDLDNQIIYMPRGENNSTDVFLQELQKNNLNNEIKRIDSLSMAQIIQQYDNCVGIANCKYLSQEIQEKLFTELNTEFKIPSTEIGIYYRRDYSSNELKNLIKIIKNNFNYNK